MDDLVTVATYRLTSAAEAARLVLEQEGIRTFLADDNLVATNWFLSNAVGDVKLQVAREEERHALEILERSDAGRRSAEDGREDWIVFACEECGKPVHVTSDRRGRVETCPHCDEYVDVPENARLAAPPADVEEDILPEPPPPDSRTTRQLWLEVFVILCLAVIPDLFWAIAAVTLETPPTPSLFYQQVGLIVRSLHVALPVLLILSLAKSPWSRFGLVRISWLFDLGAGLVVWVIGALVSSILAGLLPRTTHVPADLWAIPTGAAQHLLLVAGSLANGFGEEFILRGYLLTRLESLLRSRLLAVLITTALFASYHVYQGAAGVLNAAAFGLVFGVSFCVVRRIWPVCFAHAFADWFGLVG